MVKSLVIFGGKKNLARRLPSYLSVDKSDGNLNSKCEMSSPPFRISRSLSSSPPPPPFSVSSPCRRFTLLGEPEPPPLAALTALLFLANQNLHRESPLFRDVLRSLQREELWRPHFAATSCIVTASTSISPLTSCSVIRFRFCQIFY